MEAALVRPHGHHMLHRWGQRWVPIIAVAFSLAGCSPFYKFKEDPPGPGVPRISQLEWSPNRIALGCPATLRFLFEDPDADLVRIVAHWELHRGKISSSARGYITLPVAPGVLAGRRGEVSVQLIPERDGHYRYHIQAEDARGQKSNILQAWVIVDRLSPWATTPPICEASPAQPTEHPASP
jgi:hypothetical protein